MEKTDNPVSVIGKSLFSFTKDVQDIWTVDDAIKGISIIGGTGSGKTSASGKKFAMKFLEEGWGGIVLCAKTEEADLWRDYCRKAGRTKDLIMFHYGAEHKEGQFEGEKIVFNPIDYEMKRSGQGAGQTQNLTNIFMNIYQMGNRINGGGEVREDRFWDTALKRCLNRVIELIKLANEDLTYLNMVKVLSSSDGLTKKIITDVTWALESGTEIPELDLKSNYCLKLIADAYNNAYVLNDSEVEENTENEQRHNYLLIEDYFVNTLPKMGEKTGATISESFMGLAEPFLSGVLYEHFSGSTNIFPECTFEQQKIIILDFPVKEYLEAGIIAQAIFKLMFQQAVERRNVKLYPTPVFLWADEAQYFITAYDQLFLTTARSSRTATVFLSQNISNYYSAIGANAKAKVDSLMGNLCTKIFHANSDAVTNEYASRLIGSMLRPVSSFNSSHATFGLQNTESQGVTMTNLAQVEPREFTTLKTGGVNNGFEVQCILAMSGKEWSNKKNYLRVAFIQDFTN